MKLIQKDRELLLSWGHDEKEIQQIEEATKSTKTSYTFGGVPISREEVICLLGRETYLSGLSRSAFHFTAVQYTDDGRSVYFDSSRLFKGGNRHD